jgi:hypothetical protein
MVYASTELLPPVLIEIQYQVNQDFVRDGCIRRYQKTREKHERGNRKAWKHRKE